MALWQDIRYTARLLVKDRWFTIVAAVALALGIGVNATVFTLVNAVLLRGLPFENPDRIMWAGTRNAKHEQRALSILDFEDWRSRATLVDHLVLWQSFAFNVSDPAVSRIGSRVFTSPGTSSRRLASSRSSAATSSPRTTSRVRRRS